MEGFRSSDPGLLASVDQLEQAGATEETRKGEKKVKLARYACLGVSCRQAPAVGGHTGPRLLLRRRF